MKNDNSGDAKQTFKLKLIDSVRANGQLEINY